MALAFRQSNTGRSLLGRGMSAYTSFGRNLEGEESNARKRGGSTYAGFFGGTNSNARINLTNAVNSSRFARWLPTHILLPAPYE